MHFRRSAHPRPNAPAAPRSAAAARSRPARREHWLYGRHAVAAALANPERRWRRLLVAAGHEDEAERLLAAAVAERRGGVGPALNVLAREALAARLPPGAVHQGLALEVEPLPAPDFAALLHEVATTARRCVVVVLDQVTDPHNVGAVLRAAAAFGAEAVVVASHDAPPISGALAKAASGAVERIALIRVVNLARALAQLKAAGFWVCGLDETAAAPLAALDLGERVALVLGSEGSGLRRLVRAGCDYLARLPTSPRQPTLNVAGAAAVALYELVRRAANF